MVKKVLLHPYVTEKTMNHMTGTPTQDFKDGNKMEFIVVRLRHQGGDQRGLRGAVRGQGRQGLGQDDKDGSTPSSSSRKDTRPRTSA